MLSICLAIALAQNLSPLPPSPPKEQERGNVAPAELDFTVRNFQFGDGHFDGRSANLAMGRNLSGHDGRADATGISSGANRGTESNDAQDDHRRYPKRSRL